MKHSILCMIYYLNNLPQKIISDSTLKIAIFLAATKELRFPGAIKFQNFLKDAPRGLLHQSIDAHSYENPERVIIWKCSSLSPHHKYCTVHVAAPWGECIT